MQYRTVLFGTAQFHGQSVSASIVPYGINKDAGNYALLNGVRLYYEIYGNGDPLILLHDNGGNGGIIGLMMGIYFPGKVEKIAAFGANLWPDTTATYPREVEQTQKVRKHAEEMIERNDTTQDWFLIKQRYRLMEFQPHICAFFLVKHIG